MSDIMYYSTQEIRDALGSSAGCPKWIKDVLDKLDSSIDTIVRVNKSWSIIRTLSGLSYIILRSEGKYLLTRSEFADGGQQADCLPAVRVSGFDDVLALMTSDDVWPPDEYTVL